MKPKYLIADVDNDKKNTKEIRKIKFYSSLPFELTLTLN